MKTASFMITTFVMLLAEQVAACPGCVDARTESATPLLISTAALSLIPLAFIGGVASWVIRRENKGEQ